MQRRRPAPVLAGLAALVAVGSGAPLEAAERSFHLGFTPFPYDVEVDLFAAKKPEERDTGLWNENLVPRKARKVWRGWLRRDLAP